MNELTSILTRYWGYAAFRPGQEEIIQSVLDGHDTLALLPTGGGKSICFQVPAMLKDGLCIVVSPLIALMKDQEQQLRDKNIRAVAIVSGMKKEEVTVALENCLHGDYKFLYVSPERLESEQFIEFLVQFNLNLIAIDEAHCISQWGYDFRPPYLRIASIRKHFPEVPVLALTASATPEVRDDICDKLEFKNRKVFTKSFARPNISYLVRKTDDKQAHLLKILKSVPGTSIVYVRNRRKTKEISDWLNQQKISSQYYHAGLDQPTRFRTQMNWMQGTSRVIVATNAFGMGINKPEVRSVVHLDLPDDLESYYQEAGRAGRDEKASFAVVLYNDGDITDLDGRSAQNFPEPEEIRRVYQAVANYLQVPVGGGLDQGYEFDFVDFSSQFRIDPLKAFVCLRTLELDGYVTLSEQSFLPSRIFIPLNQLDLYKFQVEQPSYDHLIKTILRSYAGLFSDYTRFSETELAQRAAMDRKDVINKLIQLHQLNVIRYIAASDLPRLTYTERRVEASTLNISKKSLADRRQRYEARIAAFKRYLTEEHQCRSMMILSYFGEKNLQRCGTCDYCRSRNKLEMNDLELEQYCAQIASLIGNKAMPATAIVEELKTIPQDKVIKVLRWMLDSELAGTDISGNYYMIKADQ